MSIALNSRFRMTKSLDSNILLLGLFSLMSREWQWTSDAYKTIVEQKCKRIFYRCLRQLHRRLNRQLQSRKQSKLGFCLSRLQSLRTQSRLSAKRRSYAETLRR